MSWSWRLARIRGVDVNVHATFVILLVWILVASHVRGNPPASTLGTLLFTLAVFGSVLLHEFGHVLVAQHYGIGTKRITLLPIGGVAELERMPHEPREELLVTLAGPGVNVAIGLSCLAILLATGQSVTVEPTGLLGQGDYIARLFWVQVSLVVFNAIPAFPMDGGRVLRALLSMRMGWLRATRIAAGVGQALALVFAFLGLLGNVLLLFIGLFVWIGAHGELLAAETRAAIEGLPARAAAETDIPTLSESDTLAIAARRLLATPQRDFPVTSNGTLVGVLTRDRLLAALRTAGTEGRVRDAMTRDVLSAGVDEPLADVLERMRAARAAIAALTERGAVIGLLTAENIAELISVRRALDAYAASR